MPAEKIKSRNYKKDRMIYRARTRSSLGGTPTRSIGTIGVPLSH